MLGNNHPQGHYDVVASSSPARSFVAEKADSEANFCLVQGRSLCYNPPRAPKAIYMPVTPDCHSWAETGSI